MPFGKSQRTPLELESEPFWPAFWMGLLFCVLAPTVFADLTQLAVTVLDRAIWLGIPWTDSRKPEVFDLLAALSERTLADWLGRLIPMTICALLWCAVHCGRTRIVSATLFLVVAVMVPSIVIAIVSPVYAAFFDPYAKEPLRHLADTLIFSLINPLLLFWAIGLVFQFLGRSLAWVHAHMATPGFGVSASQSAVYVYLGLVVGSWTMASAAGAYALWRGTATTREMFGNLAVDTGRVIAGPFIAIGRLGGLIERPHRRPGQMVAHAIAAPWLIPPFCALIFLIANRVPNPLFPLGLVLFTLIGYALARALWSLGGLVGLTNYRLSGALFGFVIAFLVSILCTIVDAQVESLRVFLKSRMNFEVFATIIPVFLTVLISLYRGTRAGWRAGGAEFEPVYSSGR